MVRNYIILLLISKMLKNNSDTLTGICDDISKDYNKLKKESLLPALIIKIGVVMFVGGLAFILLSSLFHLGNIKLTSQMNRLEEINSYY